MAIELSSLTFTEQDDVVPAFGVRETLINTGIANTLAGNDRITGVGDGSRYSISNYGTLNTAEGNDIIIAENEDVLSPGLFNYLGIIDTGNGNDTITGTGVNVISNLDGTINTGNGEDSIICQGRFANSGNVFLGEGNDSISARFTGPSSAIDHCLGIIDTGNGNDTITGAGNYYGISNMNGIINTGNGEDSIICRGEFFNSGNVFLGDDNDLIIADTDVLGHTIINYNFIRTGDGNDTITSTSAIYNQGVIETGDGEDSIIVDRGVDGTDTGYGISNSGGAINMGDGNDSIIANEGFESGPNSSGAWFLGEGEDYIKGYGSGDFYGGNGNDTLELTPGTYTVGIWGEGWDTSVIFTKGNQLMITSEFEKLKAGNTIYDFTSLTAGQIIVVA
jgi:hypothetical protein